MSDKTTAALAAEQADAEATTTQEAELLPAATLDELESRSTSAPSQRASAPRSVSLTTAAPTGPSARSPTSAASTTA